MKKFGKLAAALACVLAFSFISIAFAAVNDQLNIFGSVSVKGSPAYVLETGENVNAQLKSNAQGVRRIVFDLFSNYEDKFDHEDGINIHTLTSPVGSIKLFYDATARIAYILVKGKDSADRITANPDSSGMFEGISSLESVHFYSFDTSNCTSTAAMYKNCTSLDTVYVREDPVYSAVTDSKDMFLGCYELVGGFDTRVYPQGTTETAMPLDKTNAKIDGGISAPGYYTYSNSFRMPYFDSNMLKEGDTPPTYTVIGSSTFLTVANALDSSVYSKDDLTYALQYFVEVEGEWSAVSTESFVIFGGAYRTMEHTVAPIVKDGVTYSKIKVTATATSGGAANTALSAIFEFDYAPHSETLSYADGVITLRVNTKSDSGNFKFTWESGVITDASDPNLIFTSIDPALGTHTAALNAYTTYEFLFFVTDATLLEQLAANEITPDTLIKVSLN